MAAPRALKSSSWGRALAALWILGVLALVGSRSPLFNHTLRLSVEQPAPVLARLALPNAVAPEGSPVTSVFRSSPQHLGRAAVATFAHSWQVAWRSTGLNVGIHTASKSSVAVDDVGLVVGGDSGWLWALDHSGAVQWRFFAGGSDRGIHATAALDPHTAYVGAYNGAFYALDRASGAVRWAVDGGVALGASPTLWGSNVAINVETTRPANGFVALLDRSTGHTRWVGDWLGEQSHSTPTVHGNGSALYVGNNRKQVLALRAEDGRQLWRTSVAGDVKSTLPVTSTHVILVTMFAPVVVALHAANGQVLWQRSVDAGSNSSPAVWEEAGLAFFITGTGRTMALRVDNGEVAWERPGADDARVQQPRIRSSPLLLTNPDGQARLWVECAPELLCALDASNGGLVFSIPLQGRLTSAPVFHGSSLYLSEDAPGGVVRLDPAPR